MIALGALLPGIGGSFTRLGYTEVLCVTEVIGLTLIWRGYLLCIRAAPPAVESVSRGLPPINSSRIIVPVHRRTAGEDNKDDVGRTVLKSRKVHGRAYRGEREHAAIMRLLRPWRCAT